VGTFCRFRPSSGLLEWAVVSLERAAPPTSSNEEKGVEIFHHPRSMLCLGLANWRPVVLVVVSVCVVVQIVVLLLLLVLFLSLGSRMLSN